MPLLERYNFKSKKRKSLKYFFLYDSPTVRQLLMKRTFKNFWPNIIAEIDEIMYKRKTLKVVNKVETSRHSIDMFYIDRFLYKIYVLDFNWEKIVLRIKAVDDVTSNSGTVKTMNKQIIKLQRRQKQFYQQNN